MGQQCTTRYNQVQSGTTRYNQVESGTSGYKCTRYQCTRCTNKTKTKSAVLSTSLMLFLAPQSGAHTIAPHRDPIQPIPYPSNPLIALEHENPEKTHDVIYF